MSIKLATLLLCLLAIVVSAATSTNQLDGESGPPEEASKKGALSLVDESVRRVLSDKIKTGDKKLKRAVAKIDGELAAEPELGDEVQPNLNRILAMIEEATDYSGVDASRLDGLQLLASLQKVWQEGPKCDYESYKILAKNNEALGVAALVAGAKFSAHSRRIPRILHKIARKHADACRLVYPKVYKQLVQDRRPSWLEKVKTFFDLVVEVRIHFWKPTWSFFGAPSAKLEPADALKPKRIFSNIRSVAGSNEAQIAYEFLRDYVRDDPAQWFLTRVPVSETDNRLVLNEEAIRQLLIRHLVEPCEKYVHLFGPTVFEPTEFYATIIAGSPEEANLAHEEDLKEFQRARIRYNLCSKLIDRDMHSLLRGILAIARKAPVNKLQFD